MSYYENFEPDADESGIEKMARDFEVPLSTFDGCQILFALYETPDYEGYAFVLFAKDGELYEVNGSHCSCYGLEGQWSPEKVVGDELISRTKTGYGPVRTYGEEITRLVQAFYPEVYGPEPFDLYEFIHEC